MFLGVSALAPGRFHTLLVHQDGSVWSTGVESDPQSERFVRVIPSGATAAAAGTGYSIVLQQDGSVWAAVKKFTEDFSFFGESTTSTGMFSVVKTISGAMDVAAGSHHSILLTQNGKIWAMGWNKYGQLGDGSTVDRSALIRVSTVGKNAVAVAAGDIHSIVLRQDGSVWATGRNNNGQLGDGSNDDRKFFAMVISRKSGVVDVAAGGYHSMLVKQDGSVWATGWNKYGQLGDGSTTDRTIYVEVVSGGAIAIAAGTRHTMMLKEDDSVWITGHNEYGQLGTGQTTNSHVFVQVIPDGAQAIAAGGFHSMVLKQDGSVWATGSNKYGQFGDGSTTSRNFFIRLAPFGNGLQQRHTYGFIR